jgi:uncharacterized protein YjbI with pentapeptide repeats
LTQRGSGAFNPLQFGHEAGAHMLNPLTTNWLSIVEALSLLACALLMLAAVDGYLNFLRPAFKTTVRSRLHGYLIQRGDALSQVLTGLWSQKLSDRLSALSLISAFNDRETTDAAANVLIAFVRHRLSPVVARGAGDDAIFEDVKIALDKLSSPAVRSARRNQLIDLSGVDFSGAGLAGVDFSRFRLANSKFDSCHLASAIFNGADLSGASFVIANLSSASFIAANLSNADLAGADLTGASLNRALLKDANVSGAILMDVSGLDQQQLDDAYGDDETAIPQQFKLATAGLRRAVALVSNTAGTD